MDVPKKVTDFIKLDAGNIGRKSAVVTGAALAASVLGTVLMTSQAVQAGDHCDCHVHHQNTYHLAKLRLKPTSPRRVVAKDLPDTTI